VRGVTLGVSTDRVPGGLGARLGVGAHGESVKDAVMDANRLVLPEHAMCAQLRQPDVEDVVALRLRGRKQTCLRVCKVPFHRFLLAPSVRREARLP